MNDISFLEWFLLGMPIELFVGGTVVALVAMAVAFISSKVRRDR